MRYIKFLFVTVFFALEAFSQIKMNGTSYVNPFIGCEGGNVFPGASIPFGMIRLGPDMFQNPPNTSGYNSNAPIIGFSHTHLSGTGGGPRYGNILVTPIVGKITLRNTNSIKRINEFAAPGYYSIYLARIQGDVNCELTSTQKVGIHRYRFSTWDKEENFDATILINPSYTLSRGKPTDSKCLAGNAEIISNTEIQGFSKFAGGWGGQCPFTIYYYIQLNKPCFISGTWIDSTITKNKMVQGNKFGVYVSYKSKQNEEFLVKVAISYISIEKAKANMNEISNWDFDQVRSNADSIWNNYLGKIDVSGANPEQQIMFYSFLRNTMIMPTDVTGENPFWTSTKPHYWEHYALWDVHRSVMPLYTLIIPERQITIINSLLDVYDHKGWLPDAFIAGHFANIQGGTNVDNVIADAVVKGLSGFDIEKAYEAIKKNATIQSDSPFIKGRYLNDYLKYGYVLSDKTDGVSSRTLEYAYNDFCISQVAKVLGKNDDYSNYLAQSQNCFKIFHDSAGYFWAKDANGKLMPNFSRDSKRADSWNDPYFYEGGSETYSYYVPHNNAELIKRMGGNEKFNAKLDDMFDAGRFKLGNEPLFLVPYIYNYAARPDKTAYRVRQILKYQFSPGRKGLPGQDDSGAISSWYVFSSMGFFPVAGQDLYLIGSPIFKNIEIQLNDGKILRIIANNVSDKNIYIQSATFNGINFNQSWFKHSDIIQGAEIIFEMGDKPSEWAKQSVPPSYK